MSPHRIVTENQLTITVAVVDIKPLSPLLVRSILLPMGNIPEQVDMHHPFPHIFPSQQCPSTQTYSRNTVANTND